MKIKKIYSKIFSKQYSNPKKAFQTMIYAFQLNKYLLTYFPNNKNQNSINDIYKYSLNSSLKALKNPLNSALINVFFPCEILHAFNINPLFMEGIAASMAGAYTEKVFIETAEKNGIPESYCSFHKIFLGGIENNFFPKTKFIGTTTLACDANVNTFRYISSKMNNSLYLLDIPYEISEENITYIELQIKELITELEKLFNKKFNENKLKEIIKQENETITFQKQYISKLAIKDFPITSGSEMAKIFINTIGMGTKEAKEFYIKLNKDIDNYPISKNKKRIFWINLIPFNDEIIEKNIDMNSNIQLLGIDINFMNTEYIDEENPYRGLAKKLLYNKLNGNYSRRIEWLKDLSIQLKANGIINMCQWGCKQSLGGALITKKEFEKLNIPFLILDGDSGDYSNNSKGQLKTRVEAFLEILMKENL
ncbi:2-hydroxyacyl-CoA dehydratase subunit D [Cetobacterium sp. SF1]|uniref:2-hydroxyacyl-CoA dehydratase subunit D n=1 Tax=Cetobacterium sp. SF1 TaxID=3417654 RepID=UPI003CEF4DEE